MSCMPRKHGNSKPFLELARHGPKPGCQEAEAFSILEAEALTLFKHLCPVATPSFTCVDTSRMWTLFVWSLGVHITEVLLYFNKE